MRSIRNTIVHTLIALSATGAARAQFGPQTQIFCQGPRSVGLADIDGDGHLDLVIASRQGLGIYLNTDGLGNFAQPVNIGPDETVACLVDVDNDGDMDVVGSSQLDGGLYMHRNNGSMQFAPAVPFASATVAGEIQHADLDNDGHEDLFFSTDDGQLEVCMNTDGMGAFGAPQIIATLAGLGYPKAVDVNGDGTLDIIFSSNVANEVDACISNAGTFSAATPLTLAGHGIWTDLDNDGHADALTANTAGGLVRWQRNMDGLGNLGVPSTLDPAFSSPEFVSASDLDGDGDMDAIITSSTLNEVAWFENTDGQGHFGPHQTVANDVITSAIATGDVDGDGDMDLFIASNTLNKVVQYTNLANATGKIMGRVFNDINGDGIFNGEDHGLMNVRVDASDLGSTYTNASGIYWFDAVPTDYVVSLPPVANWVPTTPDQYTATVPDQGASQHNDFGLHADANVTDLAPDLGSSPMHCNANIYYWASAMNTGNQVNDVRLTLDLDDLSHYITADPSPDSVVNGIATWNFIHVQPTHSRAVSIVVQLPGSQYGGDTLHDRLHAAALINGAEVVSHISAYDPMLACPLDPNDKTVLPAGVGPQHLTAMNAVFTYSVRFQNTGTASAINVMILDTLDSHLDPATLRVLASSHTVHTVVQPDGVVRFEFNGINLPDSGADQLGSQGFVRFAIEHESNVAEGTQIRNTAGIYFDSNPAVVTNTVFNTLTNDMQTGITDVMMGAGSDLSVFPNPTQGTATVRLSDDFQGRVDVSLFDATGSEVLHTARRANTVLIERGALPDGVYLLRATDERGTARTTRVEFAR